MDGFVDGIKEIIKWTYRNSIGALINSVGNSNIKKVCSVKHERGAVIRVGFVAQYPTCWDKQAPLFERLLCSDRFEVCIICPADYDFANSRLSETETPIGYYKELYPDINIIDFRNIDADILGYIHSMDYLFYDRYYAHYLPELLLPKYTSKWSKICLIPYCTYDWNFFVHDMKVIRYAYMYFASDAEEAEEYRKIKGLRGRKFVFEGYPVYESISKLEYKKNDKFTVLWTPRWSYDPISLNLVLRFSLWSKSRLSRLTH